MTNLVMFIYRHVNFQSITILNKKQTTGSYYYYCSGNRICHGSAAGIAVTEGGKGHIVGNVNHL